LVKKGNHHKAFYFLKGYDKMNKILILGSSGSGKSTLANQLGEKLNLPITHLDLLFWSAGWIVRDHSLFINDLEAVLRQDAFIIDGNYNQTLEKRLMVSDTVLFLNFNRFKCFYGALKRYIQYRNRTRPSITIGCHEKIDFEFVKYILFDYPIKKRKVILPLIKKHFKGNLIIFNNRKQLKQFLTELE
jgi:adenylate kinase family enzyme